MLTVSDFILEKLSNSGVKHVFGVPGDYVLNFYKKLNNFSKIKLINTTDENHAGFAADAYSRANGIGCVCVTYGVGALKIINAVAGAYAERSPLVIISGSPGIKERRVKGVLLHHVVKGFECQKKIFDNITCCSVVLDDPNIVGFKINKALQKLKEHKRPIYIELPRDIADQPIASDVYEQGVFKNHTSNKKKLFESIEKAKNSLENSKNPVILAGVQLSRFNLGSKLAKFSEKNNIPICSTLLGKSVVEENHPLFRGVYIGSTSNAKVRFLVENSDCLLVFGVLLTDVNFGFLPSKFKKRKTIFVSMESIKIKSHFFSDVLFEDFCEFFLKLEFQTKFNLIKMINPNPQIFKSENKRLTTPILFEKLNCILKENMVVIADIGDGLFGASDLLIRAKNCFISSAFYASMGFAIPASLGVLLANPNNRPIVVVGDGSFQMSCNELSTIVRNKLNPIVIILNNKGYATERKILEGSFNDISNWNYHKIVEVISGGQGVRVTSEKELDEAFDLALASRELFVIDAVVDPCETSEVLKRITQELSKKV